MHLFQKCAVKINTNIEEEDSNDMQSSVDIFYLKDESYGYTLLDLEFKSMQSDVEIMQLIKKNTIK